MEQIKAFFNGIPKHKLIVLDLWAEVSPCFFFKKKRNK